METSNRNFYMFDEARLGEVPSQEVAKTLLDDLSTGTAIPHAIADPGYKGRLEDIVAGRPVDSSFYVSD